MAAKAKPAKKAKAKVKDLRVSKGSSVKGGARMSKYK